MVVEDEVATNEVDLAKAEEVDSAYLTKVTQTFSKKTEAFEELLEEGEASKPNKDDKICLLFATIVGRSATAKRN